MDRNAFVLMLENEGYQTFVDVERAPRDVQDLHTHPFEARALIIRGELRLLVGEREQLCRAGDQFHLAAHTPHTETCGAEGVHYLAGRKPG